MAYAVIIEIVFTIFTLFTKHPRPHDILVTQGPTVQYL